MKRPVPFHPALFGMHPVLALYASNVSLVPLGDVWVPCAQTAVAALALWGLGWLVLRDAQRGAALSSALVFAFFTFGPLSDAVDPRGFGDPTLFLVSWSVLAVALAVLAAWKWKGERRLTLLLNATGSLMCLFAVVSIVSSHLAVNAQLRSLGRAGAIGAKAEGALPDIYYIILDGHGRGDVLQREFGVSSPTLEKELESRGFYVAESAHSNYMQTQISLASSLNFAYAQSLAKPLGSADRERKALDAAIDDNLASRTLKGLGYRTFAITTGFPALSFPNVDVHIQRDSGRTLFISALLQKTPVRFSDQVITSQFDSRRVALVGAFQAIKRLAKKGSAPKFVIAHVLAPHPPFVFGPNGEARRPRGPYVLLDGSHFIGVVGTKQEYRDAYRDQAEYIEKLTLETVDALLAEPGTPPIIMIQGDHGPKSGLDQESLAGTDVNEVFPILSAYYAPQGVRSRLYPTITPENSFRAVFDGILSAGLPMLDDRSYYSTWSQPLGFVDVTDQLEPRR